MLIFVSLLFLFFDICKAILYSGLMDHDAHLIDKRTEIRETFANQVYHAWNTCITLTWLESGGVGQFGCQGPEDYYGSKLTLSG